MTEQEIYASIQVASEDDPLRPEFPADHPSFPATLALPLKLEGFTNVWIKNEASNPTGTHKDRMAWEIVVTYRDIIAKRMTDGIADRYPLPRFSIISSGSAAFAIQTQLRKYRLPNLKVLVDSGISEHIYAALVRIGCEVYVTDLSKKLLNTNDILEITNNREGIDITSNEALDPTLRFYDWMSYEILNLSPEYCFLPFGSGTLYENVLNINKRTVSSPEKDRRFMGDLSTVRACHFLGATTSNPRSKADKLYSPFSPFRHYNEQWIRMYKIAGYCGDESGVYNVKEHSLEMAQALAEKQGVECEPSGIAGLALLLEMRDRVPGDARIVIVCTGKLKL